MSVDENILKKEEAFHDDWASHTGLDSVAVVEAFEALTAPENRFILSQIGDVKGKKILDVGTGLGESAIYFALKGADVTAVDISPKMIELCEKNALKFGVQVKGIVSSGEKLNVEDNSFDVVYAANIIHHITDREMFFENLHAALKPGGLFVSWDPVKYNPAINVYRRMATKVRTEDESPIGVEDIRLARRFFPDLQFRGFWLFTLFLFFKYYLIDRKHPNQVRYWKEILKENESTIGWWFKPLAFLDSILLGIPLVRRLAWNFVLYGHKPIA